MKNKKKKDYKSLGLQFNFMNCSNSFSFDLYRNCSFGCLYCFTKKRTDFKNEKLEMVNIKNLKSMMLEALNAKEFTDINKELIHNRVPIRLGNLSDAFQHKEKEYKLTYEFLKFTKENKYPVNIVTKGVPSSEYFDVLDKDYHTFHISLNSNSDNISGLLEPHAASASQRIAFIKELHKRGFFVALRVQPFFNYEITEKLIEEVRSYVNFILIGFINLFSTTKELNKFLKVDEVLLDKFSLSSGKRASVKTDELAHLYKHFKPLVKDVPLAIEAADCKYFDTLSCCGLDIMPKAFSNYLKFNMDYIKKKGFKNIWFPKCGCSNILKRGERLEFDNLTVESVVKDYIQYFDNINSQKKFELI